MCYIYPKLHEFMNYFFFLVIQYKCSLPKRSELLPRLHISCWLLKYLILAEICIALNIYFTKKVLHNALDRVLQSVMIYVCRPAQKLAKFTYIYFIHC